MQYHHPVSTFHPGSEGVNIARLVFPHAEGMPQRYILFAARGVTHYNQHVLCSQPSSRKD
jgi:hypothetical protein